MDIEKYSFLWSEVRLAIAAIALFLGGVPPVYKIVPFGALGGLVSSLLTLSWIISGVAAAYLLYLWYTGNKTLFGGKNTMDTSAFFVMIVSGINLGLVGITGTNIGMSISSNYGVFIIVGIVYLAASGYLYRKWSKNNQKLF